MRSRDFRAQDSFGLRELGVIEGPDDQAFDNIVAMAARSVNAPFAMLLVADVEHEMVKVRSCFGFEAATRHTPGVPLGPSLTAEVMATAQCLPIPDLRLNPKTARHPYLLTLGAQSLLMAPVKCPADLVIGSLAVMDRLPRIWTANEKGILQGCAFMCAQSILLRAALKTLSVVAREGGRSATMN
jgi:hypothetical protein